MAENSLKTRVIHKHDIESNWALAVNFIPKQGEIIVYDRDDTYNYERLKIGDGETVVSALPFTHDCIELITVEEIDAICSQFSSM